MRLFKLGRIVLAVALCSLPINVAADSIPTGERAHGSAVIEPAYDDSTGQVIYLLTPQRLAPLSPNNPINNVNPHAVAPLYLILYPPGTPGTFNCMGAAPGNALTTLVPSPDWPRVCSRVFTAAILQRYPGTTTSSASPAPAANSTCPGASTSS